MSSHLCQAAECQIILGSLRRGHEDQLSRTPSQVPTAIMDPLFHKNWSKLLRTNIKSMILRNMNSNLECQIILQDLNTHGKSSGHDSLTHCDSNLKLFQVAVNESINASKPGIAVGGLGKSQYAAKGFLLIAALQGKSLEEFRLVVRDGSRVFPFPACYQCIVQVSSGTKPTKYPDTFKLSKGVF